jgi:hypothetical protein
MRKNGSTPSATRVRIGSWRVLAGVLEREGTARGGGDGARWQRWQGSTRTPLTIYNGHTMKFQDVRIGEDAQVYQVPVTL